MNPPNEDNDNEGHGGGLIAVTLIAIPIFYVLSVGPVFRLYHYLPSSAQQAINMIYVPLEWVDRLPGRPVSHYVDMWH